MDNFNNGPDPDLRETANRLGVSMDTLRKRIKRGQIQAYKIDGRWYVPVPDQSGDTVRVAVQGDEPGRSLDRGADIQFLHEEIERLWAELRERDVLIERLTARPAIALPEPAEQLSQANPEPAPLRWWQRLFWWEPA